MKNPSSWFESVGGAKPISARFVAVAIYTICSATGRIGAAGVVVCYFGSHVAMTAPAFYSHSSFFRGWGWHINVGCISVLESHLNAFACYLYGLCVFPLILSLFLRLLGIHEPGSTKEMCGQNAVKRPHKFARCMGSWLLLVPSVQLFLGTLAGLTALVLVLALLAIHALVGCRRYGGNLYFWMRIAVRTGMRRALGRWYRSAHHYWGNGAYPPVHQAGRNGASDGGRRHLGCRHF
jgi:hypothetical protein